MDKEGNTLVMMGVPKRCALDFQDAYNCIHLTISPQVKKSYTDTMLGTIVMDKTFKEWFEFFIEKGNALGVVYDVFNANNGNMEKKLYKMKDFDLTRFEKSNMCTLLEMVLQEFYKKEYQLIKE